MRIAVASDGLDVAQHFSQCLNFNYYTTQSYQIIDSQNIPAQGLSAEEYAQLMEGIGIDALIGNNISPDAQEAFSLRGIDIVSPASGRAIDAAAAYIDRCADVLVADVPQDDDE